MSSRSFSVTSPSLYSSWWRRPLKTKSVPKDLENRVVEQSRLLSETAFEIEHLRGEIDIARKAEADVRSTTIEIEGHANTATQNLKAETAKLQAALDRANGERCGLPTNSPNGSARPRKLGRHKARDLVLPEKQIRA